MIQEFHVDNIRLLFDLEPDAFESDRNLLIYAQRNQAPEPELMHVMLRAIKPGDCVIDAGANIGFFTVFMSKLVGERGKVLAIEPDNQNLRKLRKNLDINSCTNVEIWPFALGPRRGEAKLYRERDNGQTTLFGEGDPACSIIVDTLDACFMRLPRHPSFMKLDIEGAEYGALRGCTRLPPCVVAEANDGALERARTSVDALIKLMRAETYSAYVPHADGSLPSLIQPGHRVVSQRENALLLFCPRDHFVKRLWPEVQL